MALIRCPECGKDVSDMASVCPNCGFSILKMKKLAKCSICGECKIRWDQRTMQEFGRIKVPYKQFLSLTYDEGELCRICRNIKHEGDIRYNSETDYNLTMGISSPPTPIPNLPKCTACGSTNLTKINRFKSWKSCNVWNICRRGNV